MEERKSVNLSTSFSRILSVLFHPVFIPVYGLMIIFLAPTFMVHLPVSMKRIIFLLVAINMTVVPLALMPLFKYRNIISSYSMEKRRERIVPLAIGTIMYIATTVIFYSYQIPVMIKSYMLAASVTSALVLIITFSWKISIHSVGMGALLASAIVLSLRMGTNLMVIWVPLLLLSGLVMTVRLYLELHKPAQVYSGFLMGFITIFIVMMVF